MANIDPRLVTTQRPGKRKPGRPPGSKTRPDSPRMIAKAKRAAAMAATDPKPMIQPPAENLPAQPANALPLKPDTEIFGSNVPDFERPPEHFAGGVPGPEPSPIPDEPIETEFFAPSPENTPPPEPKADPQSQRPLATMLWDTFINFMAVFIGPFWFPRKMGGNVNANEITYDERDAVIVSFCKYLHHLGMALLSPGQEFALAVANYSLPRLFLTIGELQKKFKKKKKAEDQPAPGDTRFAGNQPGDKAKPINDDPPPIVV